MYNYIACILGKSLFYYILIYADTRKNQISLFIDC